MDTTISDRQPGVTGSLSPVDSAVTLTSSQQEVHDTLLSYLTGETAAPAAIFKGYAGVGKSTTLGVLINSFRQKHPHKNIGVSAPTHKAVKVLKRDAIPGVEYRTVHSWLSLKEQHNEKTGSIFYAPDNSVKGEDPPVAELDILIIDETSMLSKDLFNYLVPWMKDGLKVIFTGDGAQIPPVNELDSIPFLHGKDWGMLEVELTEILRQKAGNPILEFATEIRSDYKKGDFIPTQQINDRQEGIFLITPGSTEENDLLEELFCSEEFTNDADHMKVIAWTNATVDRYNQRIRKLIYKTDNPDKIMLREKLVLDKPYSSPSGKGMVRTMLSTNDEVIVTKINRNTKMVTYTDVYGGKEEYDIRIYETIVNCYTEKGLKTMTLPIVEESDDLRFVDLLGKMKDAALNAPGPLRGRMWQQYFKTIEQFAWVKYNYAITGHKSQGSSYTQCMVLKWDIDQNRRIEERNRILYVACTRARNRLFIQP